MVLSAALMAVLVDQAAVLVTLAAQVVLRHLDKAMLVVMAAHHQITMAVVVAVQDRQAQLDQQELELTQLPTGAH
jgi:hypothetical protein